MTAINLQQQLKKIQPNLSVSRMNTDELKWWLNRPSTQPTVPKQVPVALRAKLYRATPEHLRPTQKRKLAVMAETTREAPWIPTTPREVPAPTAPPASISPPTIWVNVEVPEVDTEDAIEEYKINPLMNWALTNPLMREPYKSWSVIDHVRDDDDYEEDSPDISVLAKRLSECISRHESDEEGSIRYKTGLFNIAEMGYRLMNVDKYKTTAGNRLRSKYGLKPYRIQDSVD